jgi:hypothetical protein
MRPPFSSSSFGAVDGAGLWLSSSGVVMRNTGRRSLHAAFGLPTYTNTTRRHTQQPLPLSQHPHPPRDHDQPPGEEQAQDEEDMLDGFIDAHGAHQLLARGEEEPDSASELDGSAGMEDRGGGGEEEDEEAAAMDAEEAAFLEAQLTDERRATLRWLRRLKGHVVQYPVEFLREDLGALRPLNGLEGWVL